MYLRLRNKISPYASVTFQYDNIVSKYYFLQLDDIDNVI